MRIVGVNGIRTHGAGNIDLLLLEMRARGFETVDVELPKRYAINARWYGAADGLLVAQKSTARDIVVCHSYGALRSWHAHQVRDYRAIVCIAPAMSQHTQWRDPESVHCFYSPADWAVRWGSWLPLKHPFGRAGNRGFAQRDVRNRKIAGLGHNDFFYGQHLQRICDYVAALA